MQGNIELSYVVPVFFNQKDASVLIDLLEYYAKFSPDLLEKIEFILIDDHSVVQVDIAKHINLNYRLFRIDDDIRWNQGGARNLGAVHAVEKMILTDCDHRFPEKLLQKIVNSKVPEKRLFKFKRVDHEGKRLNSACNIFYMSKGCYFRALGVDEEFCGNYGYEDIMFRRFSRKVGLRMRYFTRWMDIVEWEIDRDNSYHSLDRDTKNNNDLLNKKMLLLRNKNFYKAHSKRFLNFKYSLIKENCFIL